MAEDGRVRIRQGRRDALDLLKSAKNDDGLPEDDFKRHERSAKAHDDYISEINETDSQGS